VTQYLIPENHKLYTKYSRVIIITMELAISYLKFLNEIL